MVPAIQLLKNSREKYAILFLLIFFVSLYNLAFSQDTLIRSGAEWKYYNNGKLKHNLWEIQDFKSPDWRTGTTPMGFGQGDEATVLKKVDLQNATLTQFYFYKKMVIEHPEELKFFLIRLNHDDGAIIFVNSEEILRTNIPEGAISPNTLALEKIQSQAEYIFHEHLIRPGYPFKKENTISAIVFQDSPRSSDCRFDFELIGYKDYTLLNQMISNINGERQLLKNKMELLEIQTELDREINQLKFLNIKNENNKGILKGVLFFLAIIIIVLAIFMLQVWSKKQVLDKAINQLNTESKEKSREMVNLSINLLKTKQFLQNLNHEINKLFTDANTNQKMQLQTLLHKMEFYKQQDEEWERLKQHFDTVHSGFFTRLKNKYPELTSVELRHCAYIRLKLFTSKIAQLMNINNKSVQASRYRIKKKMNLPVEVDLKKFLEEF